MITIYTSVYKIKGPFIRSPATWIQFSLQNTMFMAFDNGCLQYNVVPKVVLKIRGMYKCVQLFYGCMLYGNYKDIIKTNHIIGYYIIF